MAVSLPRTVGGWLVLLTGTLLADWPQFLGPDRNGVSLDSPTLAVALPEGGLTATWTQEIGDGFAGPVVAGNRCLLFHRQGGEALLESFDASTGKRQWTFAYPTRYTDTFGFDPGPRSCPTVAGERVFIHGAEGLLHAVNLKDGALIWKRDLAQEFASPPGFFGRCSSPLVMGHAVLLDIGGKHQGKPATCVAFDTATGKLLWTAGEGEADYASPVRFAPPQGPAMALFFLREGFLGLAPDTGKPLFEGSFRSRIHASVNAASPVVDGARFFLSSCYDVGAGLWEWDAEAGLKNLYRRQDVLDCHFATPVLHEGHLYGFHGRQETGQEFRCVSLEEGKVLWSQAMRPGSVTLADDKLLILSERGELLVAAAHPQAWNLHYRAQVVGAEARALPAFCQGRFYARDKRRLVCVDLSAAAGRP